jgi:glycosyltransferase 2 family protein
MSEVAAKPEGKARWKTLARLLVAVTLLGVILALVPWHDRVTWPSRFGASPLVGRLDAQVDHPRFAVDAGPFAGTTLEFEAETQAGHGLWRAVVVRKADGSGERIELDAAQHVELEKQPQEGLLTTFGRLVRAPGALAWSVVLYVVAALVSFQRWYVLLHAVHVEGRFWRVQKLAFIGLFFSNIIPGMTGGDLVKAIMVARDHPEQRPAAVLSVIVDRGIGLLGLALVAAGALQFQHGRFEGMALKLNLILGAIAVAGVVLLSKRLRRLLLLDKLMNALPFAEVLRKLDRAALLYRSARWQLIYSVVVSLFVHGMILTAIGTLGGAIGIQINFLDYYTLAPLALIAQSLPISPGGIGVGEAAFIYLFSKAGVSGPAAFALSFSYRGVQFVVSLIGGVLMATQHERPPSSKEIIEEQEEERREDRRDEAGEGGRKDLREDPGAQ